MFGDLEAAVTEAETGIEAAKDNSAAVPGGLDQANRKARRNLENLPKELSRTVHVIASAEA